MSVLARDELIRRLHAQSLVVTPLLSPQQIGSASIDLRMGNLVIMVRARGTSHVDPMTAKANAQVADYESVITSQQKHERFEIPFHTRFLLHPGSLALVPTLEWLRLPRDLHGSVTARSTWAREGLSIATATFVEPNYSGIVTLELANLGEIPIALYPGMRLAQIAFSQVLGGSVRTHAAQFAMAFEPTQGSIAKSDDFPFIPNMPKSG